MGVSTGVPLGAAMSMPLCGLRAWPLKILRERNELLRGPGTGCGMRRDSGGGAVHRLKAWSMRIFSSLTRARSAADRLTWRGATFRDWLAYCLLPTEYSMTCLPLVPCTTTRSEERRVGKECR